MTSLSALLALGAGVLSILSPCVLPLLPAVLLGAASEHRLGPLALAGGLALSFAAITLFVATIGFAIGLSGDLLRAIGGLLLIGFGAVLLLPAAQTRLAIAAGPVQHWAGTTLARHPLHGLGGQVALGALLGVVWAPCVGPTLGAASLLAAQGEDLWSVALVTFAFALGASAPLLVLGLVARNGLGLWRQRLAGTGQWGKAVLGIVLFAVGLLAVTGFDKQVQAVLVDWSPPWLTALTTAL